MRKSLESRRTIRSRITIVPNIEAPRDMSPLGVFFCPHVFPKLLIFNDLRRAARHKPLMIKHLRQNAKIVNFFLAITRYRGYYVFSSFDNHFKPMGSNRSASRRKIREVRFAELSILLGVQLPPHMALFC